MATEIERKFLIANDEWRTEVSSSHNIQQCYLGGNRFTTRIRLIYTEDLGESAYITLKESKSGSSRLEYEYPMCPADAAEIIAMADIVITKTRHIVYIPDLRYTDEEMRWEIDEFKDLNEGLIVAEIEIDAEDTDIKMPDWLGEEVTHLKRFYNESLASNPFHLWTFRDLEAR